MRRETEDKLCGPSDKLVVSICPEISRNSSVENIGIEIPEGLRQHLDIWRNSRYRRSDWLGIKVLQRVARHAEKKSP